MYPGGKIHGNIADIELSIDYEIYYSNISKEDKMIYKTLPNVTKEEIIDLSMKYVNPGKTQEWINREINIVMGKREGYCFWDMDGRKLLDIHLNGGVYNLGHRNPEVIQAMIDATQDFDIANHHFASTGRALLAKALNDVTPDGLQYSVFSSGGGEAIDLAIKSARYATQRRKIVSLKGCYHGHTGYALAAGDTMYKAPFRGEGDADCFEQVPLNDLEAMENVLKNEDVAAVIIESILATYGFVIPEPGYLAGVKKLCEKYGTLYIADEVQTGLMRTGKMWSVDHEGFTPDMIVTAKGLGGGIYPISATVMTKEAGKWLEEIGRLHCSTTGGSEIGCMVAMKVLEISTRQSTVDTIMKNSARMKEFADDIREKTDGFLVDYTHRGTIMGLKFDVEDAGKTVTKALFDSGVWAHNSRLNPSFLQFKLGLLADDAYVDELFEKMEIGINKAMKKK